MITLPKRTKKGGKVLQVVYNAVTASTSTTSTTYADATNFNATITPSLASSKILVLMDIALNLQSNDNGEGGLQILRDATVIHKDDDAYSLGVNANVRVANHVPFNYLDSPATTSPVTYKLQVAKTQNAGTNYSFTVNNYTDNISSITLMEIGA